LYTLPHNGQTLKNIKEKAELAQNNTFRYEEKHYTVKRHNKPGTSSLSHTFRLDQITNQFGQFKQIAGQKFRGFFYYGS
jgi:hypothetical protein